MKVGTAYKKVRHIESLIREHGMIKATLRYMERDNTLPQYPNSEVLKYKNNLEKKITKIEEEFDELLK